MINNVTIVGRVVRDLELRYTPNGIASTKFTVAVNRPFKGQNGEQEADFISVQAWRKQGENAANYLKKGSLVGITGRIQTGSYEGQDGKRVFTTDVVADSIQFLEPRNSAGGSQVASNYESSTNTGGQYQSSSQGQYGGNNQPSYMRGNEDPFANSKGPMEVNQDDLPF